MLNIIKKINAGHFRTFAFSVFALLLAVIGTFHLRDCYSDVGQFDRYLPVLIGSLLAVVLVVFFQAAANCRSKTAREGEKRSSLVCILVLILLSALYTQAIPLNQTPDEDTHFMRALQVSEGGLISTNYGGGIGGAIRYEMEDGTISHNTKNQSFANTALYSPTNYIVQALGIRIAGFFTDHYQSIQWGARLFNAFVCVALVALSILLVPYGKGILMILSCMPSTLQELTSVSPDAEAIALSFMIFAWVLRLKQQQKAPSAASMTGLTVLCLLLSLSKIVYVVLIFVLLLIPNPDKERKFTVWKILSILSCVLVNLLWLAFASKLLVAGSDSPSQQAAWILHNIPSYLGVMIRTVFNSGLFWLETMCGQYMGKLILKVTGFVPFAFGMLLAAVTAKANIPQEKQHWHTPLLLGITIGGSLLILTSLYVQWTPFGSDLILGIQGRYFLPLLPCLLIAIRSLGSNQLSEANSQNLCLGHGTLLMLIFLHMLELADIVHACAYYYGS